MGNAKVNAVQFGEKRYSSQFQTEDEYREAWQRVLTRAYAAHLVGNCLCRAGGERPIYIRQVADRYLLAKYPDTGPAHAADCHYFSPEADTETGSSELLEQNEAKDDDHELVRIRLPIGLRIREGAVPSPDGGAVRPGAPRTRAATAPLQSLDELLRLAWDAAGLNEWRPEWAGRRSLGTINRRMREAARRISTNGVSLADHLLLGAVKGDEDGRERNVRLVAQAAESSHRLLLLARIAGAREGEPPIDELRFVNFHGVPRVYLGRDAAERLMRLQGEVVARWLSGATTIVLAQIEPVAGKTYWRAADIALMSVTRDYVAT